MVQRADPRHTSSGENPLCPVCLQEIKAQDRVTGLRDDIMHEACDYTGSEHRSLKPPPKPPPSE
jgi:hypothetical protein